MSVEKLKQRDFVLLIDQSGSMGDAGPSGKPKWDEARELTEAVARECAKYDPDGITVMTFNNSFTVKKNITGGQDEVKRIFTENAPISGTDTAKALKHVFDEYFISRTRPITVVVVTDGKPNSEEALEQVIVEATKKMKDDNEIGVTFLQIGNDPNCRAFLKNLDDNLQTKHKAPFDIVDTKNDEEMASMTPVDILMAATED